MAHMSCTTPGEMATLLTGIAEGHLVSPAASAAMDRTLGHQLDDDLLPRFLPLT